MLLTKMASAGLLTVERVPTHQFTKLQEVRDAAGVFQSLIEIFMLPRNTNVLPEFLT